MNLAFAGTPEFAAVMLDALAHSRHAVEAVFTRPDARAGRGKRLAESPVKQRAAAAGIRVLQPRSMRTAEAAEQLAALAPDAMVVAAYGFLLPAPILAIPRHGCINVHASILPRWRGAAPVHHAILAGDSRTGVSIMQMDAGLDTGPILATRTCTIAPDDTSGSLTGRLAALGAATLVDTLDALEIGAVEARPQDDGSATCAPKLSKAQAAIDWARPAAEIERMVRAFDPWPVAHTRMAGAGTPTLRIWRAESTDGDSHEAPGTVLVCDESGLVVAAGGGSCASPKSSLPAPEGCPPRSSSGDADSCPVRASVTNRDEPEASARRFAPRARLGPGRRSRPAHGCAARRPLARHERAAAVRRAT